MKRGKAGKILVPQGFLFASTCAGIKQSKKDDLAYAEAPEGATAAAVFTTNRVTAAPVQVGRKHLKSTGGRVRAVIVNSGNANCATGAQGRATCKVVCESVATHLGCKRNEVFPSSTGIIGVQLPTHKIMGALQGLLAAKQSGEAAAHDFARAIMTTDTRPKLAYRTFRSGSREASILGIAKGSGMIHPNLATMLVFIFTDVRATAAQLGRVLASAVPSTFNCLSVDGDTSTNDTVLLLASGASGLDLKLRSAAQGFQGALNDICASLADQIVSDGEGVQHVIELRIEQARTRDDALAVAKSIAHSPLVKTAWAGADPNWGRILSSVGKSGVKVNPAKINIYIGDQMVCRGGVSNPFDERGAHKHLSRPRCQVKVELGAGKQSLKFITTDLTAEYVRINADYST